MAGAVIGKGGHNIQKLRTEVSIDKIPFPSKETFSFCYHFETELFSLLASIILSPWTESFLEIEKM